MHTITENQTEVTAKPAAKAKGKAIAAIAAVIVAGFNGVEALDMHLATLDSLKGRDLQDGIASTIRELGKSKPQKVEFSSDKETRKKQMQSFKDSVKQHKLLTQRVYLYLDLRGVGDITTGYRASVTSTGLVRATESTTLKLGAKGPSVNI